MKTCFQKKKQNLKQGIALYLFPILCNCHEESQKAIQKQAIFALYSNNYVLWRTATFKKNEFIVRNPPRLFLKPIALPVREVHK